MLPGKSLFIDPDASSNTRLDSRMCMKEKAVAVAETTSAGMATGALPPLAAMMPAALTASTAGAAEPVRKPAAAKA